MNQHTMPEGTVFDVIDGPFCLQADSGNAIRWYGIRMSNGTTGWSPEASNSTYALEPWSGGSNSTSPGSSGGNGSQTYPEPGPPPPQLPHPCPGASSGCIRTEWGTNATIRPATIVRGTCRDQSDQDWLVTFDMSQNQDWNNADESRIRLGISRSYLRGTLPGLLNNRVQVDTYSPPNIVICLGGNRFPTENSIRNNTWLWLRAQ